jgi:hypothetical protein
VRLDHFAIIIKLYAIYLTIQLSLYLSSIRAFHFSSGLAKGETPVPIPNTEVKPFEADGTVQVIVWESRKLLGFNLTPLKSNLRRGFLIFAECLY